MTALPLQELFVSNFRRLGGHRTFPLDAPVVLIHGPNGTGKTSILSALELGLTGEVRSMRRTDDRYTAHLPTRGSNFATIRAKVSAGIEVTSVEHTLTAAGDRIEGVPCFRGDQAQFFSERCFLDQSSLGRLLEIYQHQTGREDSALARFVNELLGLERLDALHVGLEDSADIRRLRKLSDLLAEVEQSLVRASESYTKAEQDVRAASSRVTDLRQQLLLSLSAAGLESETAEAYEPPPDPEAQLQSAALSETLDALRASQQLLVKAGGRLEALEERSLTTGLGKAKELYANAEREYLSWQEKEGAALTEWRERATRVGISELENIQEEIRVALVHLDNDLNRQASVEKHIEDLTVAISGRRERIMALESKLGTERELAGTLAEGLALLREHSMDNLCPACDRDFSEVSDLPLSTHLEAKLTELARHGSRLRELRETHTKEGAELQRDNLTLETLRSQSLPLAQLEAARSRKHGLLALDSDMEAVGPAIQAEQQLLLNLRNRRSDVGHLEFGAKEEEKLRAEFDAVAVQLGERPAEPNAGLRSTWQALTDLVAVRVQVVESRVSAAAVVRNSVLALRDAEQALTGAENSRDRAAQRKLEIDERIEEANRRQKVARSVRKAAADARATIVERVFTQSLNDVWRSVFTRLAPKEPFVPAFGVPTASKNKLDLKLITNHPSGSVGGSPQMMLSAGNLNTAALSLFIALHLAVEPVVPCLVFDDPVQSMDEVHVAQFAALMRVLSKQHGRQVIIAVHERDLFDYLALELGPARKGDELITIDLRQSAQSESGGVKRWVWHPDPAFEDESSQATG